LKRKRHIVNRLPNAERQKSRRRERLQRGRLKRIAGGQKRHQEQAHEEE
jgi:hypothetical protein